MEETITYSNTLKLNITQADNMLEVYINPDQPDKCSWEVYRNRNNYAVSLNDSIDLGKYLDKLGSCTLVIIASNFRGDKHFHFDIVADDKSKFKIDIDDSEEWSSQMWAMQIQKNS